MTNSSYRWVIVAAGGLLGCMAIGAMFSLPVFLLPISRDTGWSVTGVSSAMTIGFLAMAFASIAWGSLSDRLGARADGARRVSRSWLQVCFWRARPHRFSHSSSSSAWLSEGRSPQSLRR